jgi:hypothetical protein
MTEIRIPSDIDQEDRIIGTLTARQLGLIAVPAVALWLLYSATKTIVPTLVFVPVAVIISAAIGALVVGRRDGLSMDRFVLAMFRHNKTEHLQVSAMGDIARAPYVAGAMAEPLPGNADFAVVDVTADGVVDLGPDGAAVICSATSVNLLLQSEAEQEALTGAFGRFCNSLEEPVQFVTRAEVVELTEAIVMLRTKAPELPAVGLERAALDHARFLTRLASDSDATSRSVFVVFRDHRNLDISGQRLIRRAVEATGALSAAGVTLRPLVGREASRVIQRACGVESNGAVNNQIITGSIR